MNCPSCQRVLYDRRLPYCGYCRAAIPKEMQFTAERIAEIDKDMEAMRVQELERKRAAEKEQEDIEAGGSMPYLGGGLGE